MNKPRSLDEWREIIATARSSGLSDKDWCREHDISINTFYYNVKKLKWIACDVPSSRKSHRNLKQAVVPLEIIDDDSCSPVPQLNENTVADTTTPININCNGMQICINESASERLIRNVISALGESLC